MVQIKQQRAKNTNYGSSRALSQIKYIVIHYTANDGDTDESNGKYFHNNTVKASAHYFVDSDSITQSVPDNYIAWSVGGKKLNTLGGSMHKKVTNTNSISIELCDDNKNGIVYPSQKTINNALDLVRMLMKKYNIPVTNVVRHYDVTGKLCPAYWSGNSIKDGLWISDFWSRIENNQILPYSVKVTASILNVRTEPTATSKKVIAINKDSVQLIDRESNGWGHLANNAGWIKLSYTTRC